MNESTKIFEFIQNLIVDMKDCVADNVTRWATFDQLNLDSLDFVELQVAVKKSYRVDLVHDLFADGAISNIGELVDFIERKSSAVAA